MSESKHTPGPWVVVSNDWKPWPDAVEVNAVNEVICFTGGHDAKRQKSNARLIAAAPDMLAALKEARQITLETADVTGMHRPALVHQIDAAIAKAEGR